nr:bacterial Ig-like domain-containing protein [Treponemataceae bacterium]
VYELGDAFDVSGLKVTVAYSNGATATVGLSPSNAKVSGFSSLAVGTYTVEFTYNGIPVTGSLRVVVNAITSGYKKLLDEGADLLAKGSFDEAVVKINAAYESSKNDTTKMYYALAQLALISVDDGVQNIMRNNFGVTNYPDKLNALINGEWLKEYEYYEEVRAYDDPVQSDDGGYVRCNLKRSDASADGAVQIFCYDYYEQFPEYDGKWIGGWNVRDYELDGLMADGGSYTADPNVNGSYLISYWTLFSYYQNKYWDPETYELTAEYYQWEESIKPYRYELSRESNTYIKVAGGGHSSLPQYKIPSWIQDTDSYKDSLLGGVQSAQSASLLMLANIIDLNTSGLNSLVDNVLAVFSDRFDTAKALAASMSEQSVALPRQLVDALNLTEVLGDDEMIVIGKAELNVVIAALEMVKGTFEWLSSYDFSADFSALKTDIYNMGREDGYKVLFSAPTADFLGVRNKDAMEQSKSTYCEAAQLLLDSYDYITGPSSSYPPAAKDAVKETGDAIYQTVRTICDAIKNGGTVYFTSNGADSFVGTGAQDSDFGINFGKLFTPGALSDVFKKSGGRLQPYYSYEIEIDCSKEGDGWQYKEKRGAPLPAPASYADIKAVVAAAEDAFKQELEGEGWNISWSDNYISVGYKVDESVLGGILISDDISTFFKENILPLF